MNCREAQDLIPLMWDAPPTDPKRILLERHIANCSYCAAEWEQWEESVLLMQEVKVEVSEESAEAINVKVMERIYLESPWLMPGDGKSAGTPAVFRRRISLWIACFLAVFISSFLYFTMVKTPSNTTVAQSGIVETGVAGVSLWQSSYPASLSEGGGIVEPLVVSMGPAHPQYWMMLSFLGIGLSVITLTRLNRYRRQ
ncbi:zf-HC2 domain-containing protein [Paenibacillus albidus]|uniref:anti-sigma factor family protein n=1 Tax=Paenibacillus albidus TaxID=2041023 RepID=UPI001BE6CEC6|nr:zf-HC2 domain-containing protein [Paenibacillus albidus]MBT2288573.1 zf-HC2 domain-containing protein [Paenibacillus albidus]